MSILSKILRVPQNARSFGKHFIESLILSWSAAPFLFVLRVFLEIMAIFAPIAIAYVLRLIVNLLLDETMNKQALLNNFILLMLSLVLLRVASVFLDNIKKILTDNHNEIINHAIDTKILNKINSLDISFFDTPDYHDNINNTYTNSRALQDLSFMVITVIRSLAQILSCFLILANINTYVPIVVCLLIVPAIFIDNYVIKKRYKWEVTSTQERRKINYIKSILNGQSFAKEIRVFHADAFLFNRYESLWQNWYTQKKKVYRTGAILSACAQLLPHLAVYSLLFLVGIAIMENRLSVGDFTYYNGIVIQFVAGITTFFGSINKAYESEKKLSDFSAFMGTQSNIANIGKHTITQIKKIEFKNVSFKYPNSNELILKNMSFKLDSGKTTALVGINGAGKTTIVKLLLRLYEPTAGSIFINGLDLKTIDLLSLHKSFGIVLQDFNIYELTVGENVAIANIEELENSVKIQSACASAGLPISQERWKHGENTFLGRNFDPHGVILSDGQKQKLAIARAYFKPCSYFIMDEPNAALDPIAEDELIFTLKKLSQSHGTLLISHKLGVMHMVDNIIVLENGEIVEQGSHSELMQNDGLYKKLYLTQAEKYSFNIDNY